MEGALCGSFMKYPGRAGPPPHVPISGAAALIRAWQPMSAVGYKQTFTHTVIYVRFTPESRHLGRDRCMSANDPKRKFDTPSQNARIRTPSP